MKFKHSIHALSSALLGAMLLVNAACADTLVSVGSDTLEHLMDAWSAEFKKLHPDVSFDLTAAGSSTAPPALVDGSSQFGPMSRKMKPKEVKAFEVKYGYKPTAVRVAIDALAVFVHKDNPIQGLSIQQVDAAFSANRKCGGAKTISAWSDLGVLDGQSVALFGRNSKSGTHAYFQKKALCKGDFASSVKELASSDEVVDIIAKTPNGMGYSGIGYNKPGVRALPLSKKAAGAFVEPSAENAASAEYPLSRFLYIYVNKKPGEPLPPMQAEFLKPVLSEAGQKIVADHGFISLPSETVSKEMQVAQN